MATVTTNGAVGPTDTVTNTVLNTIADAATVTNIVNADISASADIAGSKLAIDALAAAYPVGSIYMNASDATNPATLLGFGTWVAFGAGRVLVGIDAGDTDFDTAEETGGAKTHTLTLDEIPTHDHLPNRNTYDTYNGLVRKSSQGYNTARGVDTTFGEIDILNKSLPIEEGGDDPHNNLQPYIVVHMWKRTA
jgi:hypothetical protein